MSTDVSRIQTADGPVDQYDHEISLVDTTAPETETSRNGSPSRGERQLTKKSTRISLRGRIATRKYAQWREEGNSKNGSIATNGTNVVANNEDIQASEATGATAEPRDTEAVDFADRGRKSTPKKRKDDQYEVDILYENQRGAFFLGIPFYSHSSLLHLDPAPWVTKDFKDSPVNITNAQVPDPTWEWAWKRWYVDMSYDVDEEGWEYSFAFGKQFVWHGTHPWFHSFVRRRRWLRKRITKHGEQMTLSGKAETLSLAHRFNNDYFTIHPKRERSPDSRRPESYASLQASVQVEEPPDEIKDIATLLRALKLAAVDREKIDIVKKFVDQGGDELAYLGSHIPNIMSSLVFQNSKAQLLSYLKHTTDTAKEHREEHDAEDRPEGDEERRRIDHLLAAIEAADEQIRGLEYWSDRKHILQTLDGQGGRVPTISTIFDDPVRGPAADEHPARDIKGISKDAEVDIDQTHEMIHSVHDGAVHDQATKVKGKGKGKTKDGEREPGQSQDQKEEVKTGSKDQQKAEEKAGGELPSSSGLKFDQLLIPDA